MYNNFDIVYYFTFDRDVAVSLMEWLCPAVTVLHPDQFCTYTNISTSVTTCWSSDDFL